MSLSSMEENMSSLLYEQAMDWHTIQSVLRKSREMSMQRTRSYWKNSEYIASCSTEFNVDEYEQFIVDIVGQSFVCCQSKLCQRAEDLSYEIYLLHMWERQMDE
jgi:hypothetical protein